MYNMSRRGMGEASIIFDKKIKKLIIFKNYFFSTSFLKLILDFFEIIKPILFFSGINIKSVIRQSMKNKKIGKETLNSCRRKKIWSKFIEI